ncbi:MAG: hypothetical protein ACK5LR_05310 [Mangrovibacterium sp.]
MKSLFKYLKSVPLHSPLGGSWRGALLLLLLSVGGGGFAFAQGTLLKEVTVSMCRSHLLPVSLNDAIGVSIPAGSGSWYDAATNKAVSNVVMPSGSQDQSFYFVVEMKNALCELQVDDRYQVNIELNDITTPVGDTLQTFIIAPFDIITIENLVVEEKDRVTWFDASSGGNQLPTSTELVDGGIYYATFLDPGCGESTTRLAVEVEIITRACDYEMSVDMQTVLCYGESCG